MDTLYLEATDDSPKVLFDQSGHLVIEGRSFMEDASTYLSNFINWLRAYMKSPTPKTIVEIKLEYVNSSSQHMLIIFLEELNKYFIMGHPIEIVWRFDEEDESLEDLGYELAEMVDLPFTIQRDPA